MLFQRQMHSWPAIHIPECADVIRLVERLLKKLPSRKAFAWLPKVVGCNGVAAGDALLGPLMAGAREPRPVHLSTTRYCNTIEKKPIR
jgi:hypothetical protein